MTYIPPERQGARRHQGRNFQKKAIKLDSCECHCAPRANNTLGHIFNCVHKHRGTVLACITYPLLEAYVLCFRYMSMEKQTINFLISSTGMLEIN